MEGKGIDEAASVRRGPPRWMYRKERPPSDDSYFENMARVIFIAGFSWKLIDDRWPEFREAFDNFSLRSVASYGPEDEARLLSNPRIIRNRAKIQATLENAKRILETIGEFGSFRGYIDSLDKKDNYFGT